MLTNYQKRKTGTSVYTNLANKYNLPIQVIKVICNHPFMFASRRISEGDKRPLMFTYLGKIKMKRRYEQEDNKAKEDTK